MTGYYAKNSKEKVFREIRVMSMLSHPYILQFCGWCSHPLSILLEYCSHGDLESFYEKDEFTVSRRNAILLHVAVSVGSRSLRKLANLVPLRKTYVWKQNQKQ